MMMRGLRVIPVIDIMNGVVVRAVAGQRADYRPLVSKLTKSTDPVDVAIAMRDLIRVRQETDELYVADLDAIFGGEPDWSLYARLREAGFRLWVDAGVRRVAHAAKLAQAGVNIVVVGLETLAGEEELGRIVALLGADGVAFSLDLLDGKPFTSFSGWSEMHPVEIARWAIASRVSRIIVLDLSRVGMAGGPGTESLLREISKMSSEVELIAGGGVRDDDDLKRLCICGVSAALVSSMLHG